MRMWHTCQQSFLVGGVGSSAVVIPEPVLATLKTSLHCALCHELVVGTEGTLLGTEGTQTLGTEGTQTRGD